MITTGILEVMAMIHVEKIKIKFEPRDLWIGVFWDIKDPRGRCKQMKGHLFWKITHFYVTIVPMFPLFVEIWTSVK
jgi:hypothetical protein